ncbi:DUF3105 domain-containing protein [Streptomyces sp. NBC_01304]|uniref:DUF3105 domain-containing protein n=1 Tax=Streptomyces sp. NBC_01304 TaxID=2903818 RepID=UPI002E0E9DB0|nr:DUF3105 domain-containing protein [Streptomyces sp. NBC_01304]
MGSSKSASNARKARIEEMRRAERVRERRNRIIAIVTSTVVVAGLVGFGSYLLISKKDEKDKKEEQTQAADAKDKKERDLAAKRPISDEKTWDAKKLGRNHVQNVGKYPMTPPVGGDHDQAWMNCNGDVYKQPIPDKHAVHSLEHGAVWVTYNDKAPAGEVKKLEALVAATPYSLMSPIKEQKGAIMLSAWGKQVTVDSAKDPRVETFFAKYVQGKQTPEPGAACTNGITQ